MSHIPSSAMPHAGPTENGSETQDSASPSLAERAGKMAEKARDNLTEKARENPKTAIAAGAAVVAGAIAAAAIPIVLARKKSTGQAAAGKAKKKTSGS